MMLQLLFFVLLIGPIWGEIPEILVDTFTCDTEYKSSTQPLKIGDLIYQDSEIIKVEEIQMGVTYNDDLGIYLVPTAQKDAPFFGKVMATFENKKYTTQYFIAIQHEPTNTIVPEWMIISGWTRLSNNAHIKADGKNYYLYQKKYKPGHKMALGSIHRTDGLTHFVLYKEIINPIDDHGLSTVANPTKCECHGTGDPHWKAFDGTSFDFGKAKEWFHLILAKDCAFDIQFQTIDLNDNQKGAIGAVYLSVVRIGSYLLTYDHTKGEMVTQTGDAQVNKVTLIKEDLKITIESPEHGLKVILNKNWDSIYVYLNHIYYSENVNGLCGACTTRSDAAYLKHLLDVNRCGVEVTGEFRRHPNERVMMNIKVDPQNVLYQSNGEKKCFHHYCSKDLETEDPQYDLISSCAAPVTVDPNFIVPISHPYESCDVFNSVQGSCKNLSEEDRKKVFQKIRDVLSQQPWQIDCNILTDYCSANIEPNLQDNQYKPWKDPEVKNPPIDGTIVIKSNYEYATLDFADSNDKGLTGCQADSFSVDNVQKFARIPHGWEIVPEDDLNVESLLQTKSFGTRCIFTQRPQAYNINNFEECKHFELLTQRHGFVESFAVSRCPSRILIRRSATALLQPEKPSRTIWEGTFNGIPMGSFGNRGFMDQDLDDWIKEQMNNSTTRASKIISDATMDNNVVFNFARDVKKNQHFLCMTGRNGKSDDKNIYGEIISEISTSPSYLLFWMAAQKGIEKKSEYVPIIEGSTLKAHNIFTPSADPHGWCVGPLDVSGKLCISVKLSNIKNMNRFHVAGPKQDENIPIELYFSRSLSENLVIKFCPVVSQYDISLGQCAAPMDQE